MNLKPRNLISQFQLSKIVSTPASKVRRSKAKLRCNLALGKKRCCVSKLLPADMVLCSFLNQSNPFKDICNIIYPSFLYLSR